MHVSDRVWQTDIMIKWSHPYQFMGVTLSIIQTYNYRYLAVNRYLRLNCTVNCIGILARAMGRYFCYLQHLRSPSPNEPNTAKLAVCCLNGTLAIPLTPWHLYYPFLEGDYIGYPYLESKEKRVKNTSIRLIN